MTLIEEAIEALKTQYSNPFTDDDELIIKLKNIKGVNMYDLMDAAEEIANDSKLPASMVDWACDMFDKLQKEHASVRVKDLMILTNYAEDREQGLYLLDRRLQEAI